MKIKYILITAGILLFTACKKQSDTTASAGAQLKGSWTWVSSDGGIGYNIHNTPATTGDSVVLQFTDASQYFIYTNDTLTSQGTYTIGLANSIEDGRVKQVIHFSANGHMMIDSMNSVNLFISDNAFDGVGSEYIKK